MNSNYGTNAKPLTFLVCPGWYFDIVGMKAL